MKGKKILVVLIVLFCFAYPVFGAKVTLKMWHLWGGTRGPLIEKMLNDFKSAHPDIEIKTTFIAPNNLREKIIQAAGTGTLPDVFNVHTGWYVNLFPEETMEELTPHLQREQINLEEILVAAEAKRSYWQGKVYSLPNVNAGAQGLFFYNKDLMRKAGLDPIKDAPTNWVELTNVSKTLVDKLNDGKNLNVIAWDPHQMAGQPALTTFSYGKGVPIISDDGKKSRLNTPEIIETMRQFDKYFDAIYGVYGKDAMVKWASRVTGADTGGALVAGFLKNAQVFYISGSWAIGQVRKVNPNMDLGVLPLPGFNGQHGGIAKDGWSYGISKASKFKKEAWELVKFITIDPKGNGEFVKAQRRPGPIAKVNHDPVYQEMGDLWSNLVKSMNQDIVPNNTVYQDFLKPYLRDVPNRRLAGESIEEIMADVHIQFQDFLNDTHN